MARSRLHSHRLLGTSFSLIKQKRWANNNNNANTIHNNNNMASCVFVPSKKIKNINAFTGPVSTPNIDNISDHSCGSV